MNTKPIPPLPSSAKSIRLTIPVHPDTHAVFQRLAKVANVSTGRAMGEWLSDTVEAAELMASTLERARAAPKLVTAELHAMLLGMVDQTKELQDTFRKFKATTSPPSCNTGGKFPEKSRPAGGKLGFPLPPAKVQAYADTNGMPRKAPK
jgi:hypothetical protein